MTERIPVNPGTVDWAGENPGIYLKDTPDGDYVTLALYFRIVLSPYGRGNTMLVLGAPDEAKGYPDAMNLCVTNNEPLTHYLIDGFVSKFPTFKGRPGLQAATWITSASFDKSGDLKAYYTETAQGENMKASMTWKNMNPPFAVEVSPEHAVTGAHDMYSVFLEAKDATISINGTEMSGRVADRVLFGKTISTAFLAFAETWVTPVK